jgi:putative DNA primase/helicase
MWESEPAREHGVGSVPEPLRERTQWIVTNHKAPIRPREGWNVPENQLPIDIALVQSKRYIGQPAYVLQSHDPFVIVDLDDVVPEGSSDITQEAQRIVQELGTYTEWSRSGEGLHLVVEGERSLEWGEKGALDDVGEIEIYDRDQYVVLTGNRSNLCERSTEAIREDAGDVIADLEREYLPKRTESGRSDESSSTDERASESSNSTGFCAEDIRRTVEEYAKSGSNQAKRTLNRWDSSSGSSVGLSSPSEADLGFASDLAFWCREDAQLIDDCFRHSNRIRSKWDEVHYSDGRTYGDVTIQKAIKTNGSTYSGHYVTG